MCGRYALYGPSSRIREQFNLNGEFDFGPRYNISPTTMVLVAQSDLDGSKVARLHRWGLIPSWAKEESIGAKLINARGETVAEKPAFRAAFRRWRCIVPASGFYEWKKIEQGGSTLKQPYFIRPREEGDLFGFAGLTERWVSPDGEVVLTCCIITTDANELMMPIHDRMPVILEPDDYGTWLESDHTEMGNLRAMLRPAGASGMIAYKVCRAVNSSRGESPTFVEPV
jgi:putative SOS response-associated peptidase YedK